MSKLVTLLSITPFPAGAPRELLALRTPELKELSEGSDGRAKAAKAEYARRMANRAAKKANAKALRA